MKRLEIGHSLGGRIVGIHVARKDGSIEYRWLKPEEQPHNMIVQSGVKQMLCYNGTSSLCSATYYSSAMAAARFFFNGGSYDGDFGNKGIFYKMGIGTGTSATTLNMTDLESPIYDASTPTMCHYSSPFIVGGRSFTGSFYDGFGKFRFRYTHYSVQPSTSCIVSEFALYGMVSSTDVMFCRVLIPQGLRPVLNPGDRVLFTYELIWNHAPRDIMDLGDLGIMDSFGNPLGICAENRFAQAVYDATTLAGTSEVMVVVPSTGNDSNNTLVQGANCCGYEYPVWKVHMGSARTYSSGQWSNACATALTWNSSHDFPSTYGSSSYSGATIFGETGNYTGLKKIAAYIEGTNYRDYSIMLQNQSTSDYNMWFLRHHGQDYKFYKMVDGVKTYGPLVIPAGKNLELNFRYTINVTEGGVR